MSNAPLSPEKVSELKAAVSRRKPDIIQYGHEKTSWWSKGKHAYNFTIHVLILIILLIITIHLLDIDKFNISHRIKNLFEKIEKIPLQLVILLSALGVIISNIKPK